MKKVDKFSNILRNNKSVKITAKMIEYNGIELL